ncbi:hypothetical protein J7E50_14480 [Pedobacter sp. ISL-68]|uniref:hypothetical protein n=1 Tax=unclassified Pedobacter TaxID=2628915 RepID=UPI001BE5D960|nr:MULTISPECIES: hypothetical protein [unclassified Pedobacter]MBT2563204.1 hypothetical protein [Pedobacter sp. ISL-64]MBT2591432.1 hypothetical protein [Pedobacter sp. ISL-68]
MATLKEILSAKTDTQLKYYLDHVDKHTSEGVRTALAELKYRNVDLPDGIDEQIEEKIRLKENVQYDSLKGWNKNVIKDIDAPEFYSQTAIYVFSILFSVFFGAVMMAINLKNAGKRWGTPILFGLLFTFGQINLAQFIPNPSMGVSLIINAVGVTIMYQIFWNKSIGKDTKYRAKPIWIPLIIGIIITIPLIYFAIQGL